jgi:hypothetical protein
MEPLMLRTYEPGRPLVFSHIPKTAGTSLRAALKDTLQPSVFVEGLDGCLFGGYDDVAGMSPEARATMFTSPEELPADAMLVAGHIGPWTTMTRYPGADHITVMRVPQVRVLSQFLHSRSVSEFDIRRWGPAAEAFRVGWLPLAEYLEHPMIAPNTDNTITRFLAWPHPLLKKTEFLDEESDEELLDAAITRLDAFAFANVVENPAFMTELGTWLGCDVPETRLNERRSVPPKRRVDLPTELEGGTRKLLDHRCRLDVKVWEHVARKALPEADLEATREAAIDKALAGYGALIREPYQAPAARRVVERLYDAKVRLDPRRRSSRR